MIGKKFTPRHRSYCSGTRLIVRQFGATFRKLCTEVEDWGRNGMFCKLTSSACLPPSYRTINTLTFSRGPSVSDLIEVVGPNLLRHVELRTELEPACRGVTAPAREVEDLRVEAAEAEATECKPRLREAMGPIVRARGREIEESTILTDLCCLCRLCCMLVGWKGT